MEKPNIAEFNTNAGAETLTKTQYGAMFWTGIGVALMCIGVIIYLAKELSDSGEEHCEKLIEPLKQRIEWLTEDKRELLQQNKRLDSANRELEKRDIINQFNMSGGRKQIILIPKKEDNHE